MVEKNKRWLVVDCEVASKMDMNSDHRAVKISLQWKGCSRKKKMRGPPRKKHLGWQAEDPAEYQRLSAEKSSALVASRDAANECCLENKVHQLEEALLENAEKCAAAKKSNAQARRVSSDKFQTLLEERRGVRHGD